MLKKILSIAIIAVLALSCLSVVAFAADEKVATLTVDTVNAAPGDTGVEVNIVISDNPGIFSFSFLPEYDTSRLSLTSMKINTADLGGSATLGTRAVWLGEDADVYFNGTILTLTFDVLADAPAGDAGITLSYVLGDACDYDENDIYFNLNPGKVVVGGASQPDDGGAGSGSDSVIPELVWPQGVAIGVESVAANAGDTVTVNVLINNNPGIFSYTLTPVYDTTRLEFVSAALNKELWPSALTVGTRVVWIGEDENITVDGLMFTLTFKVLDNAPDGKAEVKLEYVEGDICNYDEDDVLPAMIPGYVVIGNVGGGEVACEHTNTTTTTVDATCTTAGSVTVACADCGEVLSVEEIAATGHTNAPAVQENRVEATCTEKGSYDRVVYCSTCGAKVSSSRVTLAAKGHKYTETVTEATCTEQGYITYTCSGCGDSYKDNYVEPAGHSTEGSSATCTESAYCVTCGVEVEAALGHNYIPDVTAPTCTTAGYTTYNCDQCGDRYVTDEVEALGHKNISEATCTEAPTCGVCGVAVGTHLGHDEVYDEGYMATCTKDGLTAGSHCDRCGEIMSAQEVIPAAGHDEVIDEAVAATCTASGLSAGKHCGVCNEVLVAQTVVNALGHKEYTIPGRAATCTEGGCTDATACSVCHLVLLEPVEIPATGHTEVIDAAVAATCTASGLTEGKHCGVCDEVLVAQTVVDALGHTEVKGEAKEPTCTQPGFAAGTYCDVCGEVLTAQDPIPATGHTEEGFVRDNDVAPGCMTEGSYDYIWYCATCGEEIRRETETIPATGHTAVVDEAVAPTCTESGLTAGSHCEVCGDTIVAQVVRPATGHKEVTLPGKAATCTEPGYTDAVVCGNNCGAILVEPTEIDATGHAYGAVVTAPTCTTVGYTTYTCSACGDTYVGQEVAALGHTPGAEATEDTPQVCTVCGTVLVEAGNIDKYRVVLGENFAIVVTMHKPIPSADAVSVKVSGIGGAASGFYTWNDVEVDLEANTITIKGIAATYINRDFKVSVAGGNTLTVSVGDYCDASIGVVNAIPAVKAICEQIKTYADMAENYFRGTVHATPVQEYDAGDVKREVSNATAEGAVTFYSVRLSLEDGVYLLASMQNYTDEAITVTIGGKATTNFEVIEVEGKAVIKLAVKADRYNDTVVFKVGDSTLTYSVDAYIKAKQNDSNAALANLVNALGNYGKTVRDFSGKTDIENNQTEDDIL